jgi:hypothetical protein
VFTLLHIPPGSAKRFSPSLFVSRFQRRSP